MIRIIVEPDRRDDPDEYAGTYATVGKQEIGLLIPRGGQLEITPEANGRAMFCVAGPHGETTQSCNVDNDEAEMPISSGTNVY